MNVGDLVCHVDYGSLLGKLVGKYKEEVSSGGVTIWLVKWHESGHCSRHIESALKVVK